MGESSDSSFSSSSSSSSPVGHRRDKRRGRDEKKRRRIDADRSSGRTTTTETKTKTKTKTKTTTSTTAVATSMLPPAPSDWNELRAHFRFVLPEDEDGDVAARRRYGSTWQERMVRHYHDHLYKEYVLADLSRVHDLGKVGLRWRTEGEVAGGGGFRCCGNLGCPGSSKSGVLGDAVAVAEEEARYYAAARRHVGIGVPENGGRIPMGMILPKPPPSSSSSSATTEDDAIEDDPLERYLRSCGEGLGLGGGDDDDDDGERRRRRRRRRDDNEGDDDDGGRRRRRNSRDERRQRSKRERGSSRLRRSSSSRGERCDSAGGGGDDDDIVREREEMERLTDVPHGIGLHDYEVDFAYVEGNARKRELVKVRLCLRCAPLLFVARRTRRGDDGDEKDEEGGRRRAGAKVGGGVVAPAMKARAAREEAAARSRSLTQNGG